VGRGAEEAWEKWTCGSWLGGKSGKAGNNVEVKINGVNKGNLRTEKLESSKENCKEWKK